MVDVKLVLEIMHQEFPELEQEEELSEEQMERIKTRLEELTAMPYTEFVRSLMQFVTAVMDVVEEALMDILPAWGVDHDN